ncbi:hypothetical protein [Halopseudomonas pelagia]|uniref:hypothetical protein n=1 Tax=Halopseudomonas pelagia TaxID=553151 RepID=UPI0003A684AF|nr:hypothetical protein [Halopseudomonas pelagia]
MKTPEQALREDPITKHAMKLTGLSFDEIMKVRLDLPENPLDIGGALLGWTGTIAPEHIAPLIDFAILRWYYSPESHLPEFEDMRQAASMHIHRASLEPYVPHGIAVQHGRRKAAEKRNIESKASASANIEAAKTIWVELAANGRPERERVAVIAQRMGFEESTVRGWIRKAGLR